MWFLELDNIKTVWPNNKFDNVMLDNGHEDNHFAKKDLVVPPLPDMLSDIH